ncbi:MAG: hypothetical protein H7A46_12235 [Verrucomicrobiales bacterium]|nr:hypothetical protein [Verrucomicrobiales bacterium]
MNLSFKERGGRVALLATAMACLVTGIWGGLLRLPLPLPLPTEHANWVSFHGPLMVGGFLGTLIGLERAVGLRAIWAYAAPLLTGVGLVTVAVGVLDAWPRWVLAGGNGVFVLVSARVIALQRALHNVVMGAGALAWLGGNVGWALGHPLPQVAPWWLSFLLLTIVGERLELTRFQRPSRWSRPWLLTAAGVLGAGLITGWVTPRVGGWILGAALLGMAVWLLTFDIARRTIRGDGLPRFMAVCLLTGYGWLLLTALLLPLHWPQSAGYGYDAALHAFFVGFVFSMIFGHAPVIFPAVLGLPLHFRATSYVPLAVLHGSLLLRVLGDLTDWPEGRIWGGAGNGLAVALFLINTVTLIALTPRAPSRTSRAKAACEPGRGKNE